MAALGMMKSLRSTAADDRFSRPDLGELTIELATQEKCAGAGTGDCLAMDPIAVDLGGEADMDD